MPFPTGRANCSSAALKVVNLGGGDPDFDTPPHIVAAAVDAMHHGLTHYVASKGIPALRKAITAKFQRDNHLAYDPDTEVIVTASGKLALYMALATMIEPGDEVMYFDPAWVSYEPMIRMLDGIPVEVPLRPEDGFLLDADVLKRRITPRTKAMILNSPNNPTGRVLTPDELDVVAGLAMEHGFWVLSDEIYEHIIYDNRRHISLASSAGDARSDGDHQRHVQGLRHDWMAPGLPRGPGRAVRADPQGPTARRHLRPLLRPGSRRGCS